MAQPFLVLGGITVGVVTAAFGILAVPAWVANAQDAAARADLAQVSAAQQNALNVSGAYLSTVDALTSSDFDYSTQFHGSAGVALELSADAAAETWCAVARSSSGTYFALAQESSHIGQGETAVAASADAGCAPASPPEGSDPEPSPEPTPVDNPWPVLNVGELPPGGVVRAGPNTVITSVTWPVPTLGTSQPTCVVVELTGELRTPSPWSFEIEREGTPFYGDRDWWYTSSNQARFDATGPAVVVSGSGDGSTWNADWSNRNIDQSKTLRITSCSTPDSPPTVRSGEEWYTLTQTVSGTWTSTKACVDVTARGNVDAAAYPFRYGWAGTFDLRAAKKHITDAGRTVNYVGFSPSPSSNFQFHITSDARTQPVQDRYDFETGTMLALHGQETKSIQACVYGY